MSSSGLPEPGVFGSIRSRLLAALGEVDAVGRHPVARGDVAEGAWMQMLRDNLPTRYEVASGFAVDHTGALSEQIDILVFDRHYSPPLLTSLSSDGKNTLIPVEAIYAAFEVKPSLSKGNVRYAGQKVGSVRRLQPTSARIRHAGGTYEPRDPLRPIGGLLATRSDWAALDGGSAQAALAECGEPEDLDFLCAARGGTLEMPTRDEPTSSPRVSTPAAAVECFFVALLARLQDMGTAPAIDWRVWGSSLWGPEWPPAGDGS